MIRSRSHESLSTGFPHADTMGLKGILTLWATDMLSQPRTGATSQGTERGGVLCTEGERGLMPELLTGEDWQDATDLILLQGTDTAGECTARGVFCTDGGNTSEILTWEDWQDATDSWLLPETDRSARQFAVRGAPCCGHRTQSKDRDDLGRRGYLLLWCNR